MQPMWTASRQSVKELEDYLGFRLPQEGWYLNPDGSDTLLYWHDAAYRMHTIACYPIGARDTMARLASLPVVDDGPAWSDEDDARR